MLGVIHPYIVFEKAEKPTVLHTVAVYFSIVLVLKLVDFNNQICLKISFKFKLNLELLLFLQLTEFISPKFQIKKTKNKIAKQAQKFIFDLSIARFPLLQAFITVGCQHSLAIERINSQQTELMRSRTRTSKKLKMIKALLPHKTLN